MTSPSHPLWAISVDDPAVNAGAVGSPEREALIAYVKSRSLDDLARVSLREGQQPVLVELAPLTAALRAAALGFTSEASRRLAGFQYAARRVIPAGWRIEAGRVEGPSEDLDVDGSVLSAKGVARALELLGGAGIEELGSLAIQRATVHPRALSPFVLPSPSGGV